MRAIVLFARSPRHEALAKRLPDAAPLFRTLIAAWLRAAQAADATPFIACEREDRDELATIERDVPREWLDQRGATFGDRVASATSETFAQGFDSVIVAAIDAPPVELDRAFAHLERGTTVIAPSRDGGINYIGLTAPDMPFLSRLTPRRRDLVALCRGWFASLVVLDAVTDVDDAKAMSAARHERAWRGYFASGSRGIAYERTMPPLHPRRTLASRAPPAVGH